MSENNLKIGDLIKIPLNLHQCNLNFINQCGIVIGYCNYSYYDGIYQTYKCFFPQFYFTGNFFAVDLELLTQI